MNKFLHLLEEVVSDEMICEGDQFFETFGWMEETLQEAEYKGKKVTLNKPIRTPNERKKFKVYTTSPTTGNVILVRFGDPDMTIKKRFPKRRKSFRARHNCDSKSFEKDRDTPGYWSCRAW